MVKAMMARSLKGDTRAASLLLSMITRLLDPGEAADDLAEPLLEDELEILRTFEARVRQGDGDAGGSAEGEATRAGERS
jgi:hypothetical protein